MRFQPCQDSESRGDRYEEKILADIIPFSGSVVLLLLLYTSLQGLTTVTLCLAIPVLAASIVEAKLNGNFTRESGNQKG